MLLKTPTEPDKYKKAPLYPLSKYSGIYILFKLIPQINLLN